MSPTKSDIVKQIQSKLGFLGNQFINLAESLVELVKFTLASGDEVLVSPGFGKFCMRGKKEHKGGNPATGEDAILAARRGVTLKGSGTLREKVDGL